MLVEIVSDDHSNNHMIYFLDSEGQLIEDPVHVEDASIGEIFGLIKHMFVIHFTPYQFWQMQCATAFNRIFEPDMIPYDSIFAWQMDKQTLDIFRHFGKIINVANYQNSAEYADEVHILEDFVQMRPTPIEQKSEEVHERGMKARTKMLEIIREWVL